MLKVANVPRFFHRDACLSFLTKNRAGLVTVGVNEGFLYGVAFLLAHARIAQGRSRDIAGRDSTSGMSHGDICVTPQTASLPPWRSRPSICATDVDIIDRKAGRGVACFMTGSHHNLVCFYGREVRRQSETCGGFALRY